MLRFDHVGVVVRDLDAAAAFFTGLGFEHQGGTTVAGEIVDRINGLDGVRAEILMLRPPDGGSALELVRYHAPPDDVAPGRSPANRVGFRHIALEVTGLDDILAGLRERGFDLVGGLEQYGGTFRLCYVGGPEGLIVELAERVDAGGASGSPRSAPAEPAGG